MSGLSRREFLSAALGGAGAAALLPACAGTGRRPLATPTPPAGLAVDAAGLAADGDSLVTPAHGPDGASILVVREAPERFLALSMQCTHEGCELNPPAGGVLTCPCHGSRFDLAGRVLRGPADFPLARYPARYDAKVKRVVIRFGD